MRSAKRSGARGVSTGKRVTYLNHKKICAIGKTNFRSEQEHEHLVRGNTPRIAVKNCFNMDGMSKEHELVNKNGSFDVKVRFAR